MLLKKHLMHTRPLLIVFPLQKSFAFSLALQAWLKWPQNYFIVNFMKCIFLAEIYVLPIKYQCSLLTHCPLGDMAMILKMQSLNTFYGLSAWACRMKLLSAECHTKPLTKSQRWFRKWLGDVRQQAIIWANVDPGRCFHVASILLPTHLCTSAEGARACRLK